MLLSSIPLVSVIIPCYNHGKYIEDTIQSISNQSYKKIEIIIVDDGSSDDYTSKKLRNLRNKKIKVIYQENGKTSKARNTGFSHSKGKYLLPFDADDLMDESFVEKAVHILEKYPLIGIVSAWTICFGGWNFHWTPYGGDVRGFIKDTNCQAAALIRRDVWLANNGYDENMTIGYEEWEFYINAAKKGYLVHIIKEFLLYYRKDGNARATDAVNNRQKIIKYIATKHKTIFSSESS